MPLLPPAGETPKETSSPAPNPLEPLPAVDFRLNPVNPLVLSTLNRADTFMVPNCRVVLMGRRKEMPDPDPA